MAAGLPLFLQMMVGKGIELGAGFLASSAGLAAVSGGLSAYSSIQAGNAQRGQASYQAKVAEIAAQGQEVERRRRLVQSLATQIAGRGASGIQLSGSPLVSLQDTINQSGLDRLGIAGNISATKTQLSAQGHNAALQGRISAGASILDMATTMSSIGGPAKSSGKLNYTYRPPKTPVSWS